MDKDWSNRLRGIAESIPGASALPGMTSAPRADDPFRGSPSPPQPTDSQNPFHPNPFQASSPTPSGVDYNPFTGSSTTRSPSQPPDTGYSVSALKPAIPKTVRTAYLALITAAGAAVLLAGLGVYGLIDLRDSVNKVTHIDPTGTMTFYVGDYADDAEITLIASTVALGILFALAYFFVGLAVRKGRGWPRQVGTALSVFSLPAIFLGPIAAVAVLAGIVAVIATWAPSARQYAVETKSARRATGLA